MHNSFLFLKWLAATVLIILFDSCRPGQKEISLRREFENLDTIPRTISYTNKQPVNNEGGHLQGVQIYTKGAKDYVIVTGSSGTYSYYGVIDLNENAEVISINKILEKPFKHAGGFQINKEFMAIGIEDNEERNKSRVYLYHVNDPHHPPTEPIAIINRQGDYERATAGAVGITQVREKFLIVVGDWSSRNLDFYISRAHNNQNYPTAFKKVHSLQAGQLNKRKWSDTLWHSYQNLNVLKASNQELYLVGLGHNDNKQNIADLYELNTDQFESFSIRKVSSRIFETKKDASFRAGAGVYYQNNQLKIISCSHHILENSHLNLYSTKKTKE